MSTCVDHNNNIISVGDWNGFSVAFGVPALLNYSTSSSNYDAFVVKYNSNGTTLWARNIGGENAELPQAMAVDKWNNIYVTGNFNSDTLYFGNDTVGNIGAMNTFIAKFSPNGTPLWMRIAKDLVASYPYGIATDSLTGNVAVTGIYHDSIAFGNLNCTTANSTDFFVVVFDSAGTAINLKSSSHTGGGNIQTSSAVYDKHGNLSICGMFMCPSLTFDTATASAVPGVFNYFMMKLDPQLHAIWKKNSMSNYTVIPQFINDDDLGNIYLTGFYDSTLTIGSVTLSTSDPSPMEESFLAKFDSSGNVLWAKTTHSRGGTMNRGYCVVTDAQYNVYWTGGYNDVETSVGQDTFRIGTHTDPIYFLKMNSQGQTVCTAELESGGDDWVNVAVYPPDQIYISADYYGIPFTIGNVTYNEPGLEHYYLARLQCSPLDVEQIGMENVSVYPNPSEGIFTFNLKENYAANAKIEVRDVLGKVILESTLQEEQSRIDLSGNAEGMYFYVIRSGVEIVGAGKLILK